MEIKEVIVNREELEDYLKILKGNKISEVCFILTNYNLKEVVERGYEISHCYIKSLKKKQIDLFNHTELAKNII